MAPASGVYGLLDAVSQPAALAALTALTAACAVMAFARGRR